MVGLYLVLQEINKLSSKVYLYAFPPATNENACFAPSSPAFEAVNGLDFGHSDRYVMISLNLTYDI